MLAACYVHRHMQQQKYAPMESEYAHSKSQRKPAATVITAFNRTAKELLQMCGVQLWLALRFYYVPDNIRYTCGTTTFSALTATIPTARKNADNVDTTAHWPIVWLDIFHIFLWRQSPHNLRYPSVVLPLRHPVGFPLTLRWFRKLWRGWDYYNNIEE